MKGPKSIAVPVMGSKFMETLLKEVGINNAGDVELLAPIAGVYAMRVMVWVTPEAWKKACAAEAAAIDE